MSGQKGTRGERSVVQWFENHGWFAQRTGASGGATDRDRSDVIAMKPHNGWTATVVSEVKSTSPDLRIEKSEITQIESVAEQTGGLGLVVNKPDLRSHDHMYAWRPEQMKENKKSYSVTKSMVPGPSIADQIEEFLHE